MKFRTRLVSFFYQKIFKAIFFALDPELVHDRVTSVGRILGSTAVTRWATSLLLSFSDRRLEQTVAGIHFKNPIGLAAGFDKDAQLTGILPAVGFGFEEAGSITGEPCSGNSKPRLWRLVKSQSLLVYYGLKNEGCLAISKRLTGKHFDFPLGISIAKTNSPHTATELGGIQDYLKAYETFVRAGVGDYYTVNISCPNAYGGEPFTDPAKLDRLLAALAEVQSSKPLFLKMPAELEGAAVDEIIAVARAHHIAGFICTNLAKDRGNAHIHDENFSPSGGMSGKVVQELSDKLVAYIYQHQKTHGEFAIVGCGGVFTAEDAYQKIKLGASLIQMITGMIFEGPQVVGEINRGLVSLLERDGYRNISEAVGTGIPETFTSPRSPVLQCQV